MNCVHFAFAAEEKAAGAGKGNVGNQGRREQAGEAPEPDGNHQDHLQHLLPHIEELGEPQDVERLLRRTNQVSKSRKP